MSSAESSDKDQPTYGPAGGKKNLKLHQGPAPLDMRGQAGELGPPHPPRAGARLRRPVRMCAFLSLHIRSTAWLSTVPWLHSRYGFQVLALHSENAYK